MTYKGQITADGFLWALGAFCSLNRIPFDQNLILRQYPPPYTQASLQQALKSLGFRASLKKTTPRKLPADVFPCLAVMKAALPTEGEAANAVHYASTAQGITGG